MNKRRVWHGSLLLSFSAGGAASMLGEPGGYGSVLVLGSLLLFLMLRFGSSALGRVGRETEGLAPPLNVARRSVRAGPRALSFRPISLGRRVHRSGDAMHARQCKTVEPRLPMPRPDFGMHTVSQRRKHLV